MKNRDRKGFSLLELTIMTFIVITLSVMVLGLVSRSKTLSKSMVCLNNLRQISMTIQNYQADWKESPSQIVSMFPYYLKDKYSFKCPEDRVTLSGNLPTVNSYGNFYVNRSFQDEDTEKIYLYCPRHFAGSKGVASFLSYSASVVSNQPVTRNGIKVMPGDISAGGTYKFADGTTVTADPSLKVGVISSFVSPDGKNNSIIFVPEATSGTLTVEHNGDSKFEIVTPAVIAGVSGTKFTVNSLWDPSKNNATTTVNVTGGAVKVEDRTDGSKNTVNLGETFSITVECASISPDGSSAINATRSLPRRPIRRINIHH